MGHVRPAREAGAAHAVAPHRRQREREHGQGAVRGEGQEAEAQEATAVAEAGAVKRGASAGAVVEVEVEVVVVVGGWRHVLLTGAACALRWVVQEDTDDEAYRRRHIRGKDELKHRMLVAQRALEKGPNYRPRPPPRQRGPPVLPRRQSQQAANKPASPQPAAGRPRNGFQLSAAPRSQQQQEKQPKQAHAQHRVGQGVQMNGGHA